MSASRSQNRLWLATLLTGLLGFVLLSTLEENIRTALQSRSRELLGGDFALSSRRWPDPSEVEAVREELEKLGDVRETEVLEFFSMVSGEGTTPLLVELMAVEPGYPLVGKLALERSSCEQTTPSCAWSDPALQIRWKLVPGVSRLQIGEAPLRWGGRIERDTSRSLRGSSFAPRVVLSRASLPQTGLLRAGATVTVRKLFAVDPPPTAEALAEVASRLDRRLQDPGIQLQTPRDASEDEGRLLRNVADYLGLSSLVGLLLAFLGCAWLLRREITQQARNWAILRVLSPRPWRADAPFWKQAMLVSLAAAGVSLAIAQGSWWILGPKLSRALFLEDFLPSSVSLRTAFLTLLIASGTSVFALWPSLRFLKRQNLAELLKNPEILAQKGATRPTEFLVFVALLLLMSRWISNSWRVSVLFLGTLGASAGVIVLAGWLALKFLGRTQARLRSPVLRWSSLSTSRLQVSSLLVWLTLSLGALLLTLMPVLESSFRKQLEDPRIGGPVPSLFLFDIQEEQLRELQQWARSQGTELQFVTPLIRGRLLRVNGAPFEKLGRVQSTREDEREARFRNRGINLTIRDELTPSESIIAGKQFSELPLTPPSGPEALSVERRYAERLGMKLGDVLDFEIQGVPITGKIVNLRRVQWTSFQPNFFITFKAGALSDAPKSYLASLPRAEVAKREEWQAGIFQRFPNVSSIDVTRLMETLLEGFTQISAALRIMAILAGVSGMAAVFSVLRLRARERQSELQLLKILGASPRSLIRAVSLEAGLLSAGAAGFGVVLSLLVGAALSIWIFDSPPAVPPLLLIVSIPTLFGGFGAWLGWLAARDVLQSKPQEWLRSIQEGA
jgi:putative ABC transport system permease protein